MSRRQLTIVSGQPLPNYIAVNEGAFRPDVLHCLYTPGRDGMDARLEALTKVLRRVHPTVRLVAHEVPSAYDPLAVLSVGKELLRQHPQDDWSFNGTPGTKLMSAPLEQHFHAIGRPVLYVDTSNRRMTQVAADWTTQNADFEGSIDVPTYFELFGQSVTFTGVAQGNPAEADLLQRLGRLRFDHLGAGCKWQLRLSQGGTTPLADYDVAGTAGYRLLVFERKRLFDVSGARDKTPAQIERQKKQQSASITHDLEKLAYTKAVFGGPFGDVYWVFDGTFQVSTEHRERFSRLGVAVIEGRNGISRVDSHPADYRLPPRR